MSFIFRGLAIGVISAVPIGPIALMAIQKCVNDGRKAGFSCGLGGTLVDTVCAVVSAFALATLSTFISDNSSFIQIAGGLIILCLGINMFFTKIKEQRRRSRSYDPYNFIKAAMMGFSNPAAIAVMLALFASFGMDMSDEPAVVKVLSILAVSAGSALYWYLFTRVIAHFGEKINFKTIRIVNRLAGVGVMIFAIVLLCKGIFQ